MTILDALRSVHDRYGAKAALTTSWYRWYNARDLALAIKHGHERIPWDWEDCGLSHVAISATFGDPDRPYGAIHIKGSLFCRPISIWLRDVSSVSPTILYRFDPETKGIVLAGTRTPHLDDPDGSIRGES